MKSRRGGERERVEGTLKRKKSSTVISAESVALEVRIKHFTVMSANAAWEYKIRLVISASLSASNRTVPSA